MTIQSTMKAAVVERFGEPLVIREVPVPKPGPGQALVEIIASGVCHTDLHAANGDWPVKPALPFTPGHEGAGVVVALGPGVTYLKEGDRVGILNESRLDGHPDLGQDHILECLETQNSRLRDTFKTNPGAWKALVTIGKSRGTVRLNV